MKKKTVKAICSVLVLAVFGLIVWHKLMRRDVPQPSWISATQRNHFLYGSVGAEQEAGIPYWIWLALPRMFPDYVRGNGGYVALGASWEQGVEMPAGFSKKRVGYIRVAGNCALCHAASYRLSPDEGPVVVPFVPGRGRNVQKLLTFFKQCAEDPRFNSDEILTEVKSATRMQLSDYLLYRFYLVPHTRKKLQNQEAVIINASLDLHSRDPHPEQTLSRPEMKAFADELREIQVPVYPLPRDKDLVKAGEKIFSENCASCHAEGGRETGTVISIDRLDTDPQALQGANAKGYVAHLLAGVWMRGPYLHNGSVPTVRDLLNERRPSSFYTGNNVLDPKNLGFYSNTEQEKGLHFERYDTNQPGKHNSGHLYGTHLSDKEKDAVVEYLKTL